jgi:hypothetical protein
MLMQYAVQNYFTAAVDSDYIKCKLVVLQRYSIKLYNQIVQVRC